MEHDDLENNNSTILSFYQELTCSNEMPSVLTIPLVIGRAQMQSLK